MKNKFLGFLKKIIVFLIVAGASFLILVMAIGSSDIINQDGFLSFLAALTPFVAPIFLGLWAAKKIHTSKHIRNDDATADCVHPEEGTIPTLPSKKPFYKRWWIWALIILVLLGSCGVQAAPILATNESEPTPIMNTGTTEQTEAVAATMSVAAEPTEVTVSTKAIKTTAVTETPETTVATVETTFPPLTIEDAVVTLGLILPEGFKNYSISHEGNLITIGVWEKGVVDVIDEISRGHVEYKPHWDVLVNSYISTTNSYCTLVKDMGIEDTSIALNLLNDYDRETILLSVIDGVVEYDCLADLPTPETKETLSARDQLDSIMATYNPADFEKEWNYVLNTNTMKFHYVGCSSVGDIKPSNRLDVTASRAEVIVKGYNACKRCSP